MALATCAPGKFSCLSLDVPVSSDFRVVICPATLVLAWIQNIFQLVLLFPVEKNFSPEVKN